MSDKLAFILACSGWVAMLLSVPVGASRFGSTPRGKRVAFALCWVGAYGFVLALGAAA